MEVIVWIDNAREFSQVVGQENAPLAFARCVQKFMMGRDAEFDHSGYFITFANRHISVMMLGVITQEMYDITRKEVRYILRDHLPDIS